MGPAERKHLTTLETNPARLISRPKGRTGGVGIVLTRDDHDADRGIRHLIRPPRTCVRSGARRRVHDLRPGDDAGERDAVADALREHLDEVVEARLGESAVVEVTKR